MKQRLAWYAMSALAAAAATMLARASLGRLWRVTGHEPSESPFEASLPEALTWAAAAGVMPLGFIGTVADFSDWDAFRAMVRRARRFGFDGAGCIHPGQVKIVNEEYTPSEEEVAYARKVIKMDQEARAAGRGSFQIDGKMIDIPVVVRAERLVRRYEAIKRREAKTLTAAR